jgi:hypothetical protein
VAEAPPAGQGQQDDGDKEGKSEMLHGWPRRMSKTLLMQAAGSAACWIGIACCC